MLTKPQRRILEMLGNGYNIILVYSPSVPPSFVRHIYMTHPEGSPFQIQNKVFDGLKDRGMLYEHSNYNAGYGVRKAVYGLSDKGVGVLNDVKSR